MIPGIAAMAASAVGGGGGGILGSIMGSLGGGGGIIGSILGGLSGASKAKQERKMMREQIKAQKEMLQMSLAHEKEMREKERGYELEDRQYRQDSVGNYKQFHPTGLMGLGEDPPPTPAAATTPAQDQTPEQTIASAGGTIFNPQERMRLLQQY